MKRFAYTSTSFGFIFWIILLLFIELSIIEQLLLFAFFVTVPLTLLLTETKSRIGKLPGLYRVALYIQFPMAILAALSFLFPSGVIAGGLSLGWLLFTVTVALYGLLRFLERGWYMIEEVSIDVGLMYVALGGAWFSIHRFGIDMLDFNRTIILLTAIHFHFSAFVTPIFAGLLGRMLKIKEDHNRNLYRITVIGIMTGSILIAAGITYSGILEFFSVLLFVACLILYACQAAALVSPMIQNWLPKILLVVSSVTLLLTMSLSFIYGLGEMIQVSFITIPQMVLLHGVGNAFGFVFAGVLAWVNIQPEMKVNLHDIPHSSIYGKWRIGADFFERNHLHMPETPVSNGLVDQLRDYGREDFDPEKIHPDIVSFYENTMKYELTAKTSWKRGFGFLSRVNKLISRKIQQINLPLSHEEKNQAMYSKIIPLDDKKDGREKVRAWVRTGENEETIFAAAYSSHSHQNETYMNIALPLPFGNMTGILRLDHVFQEKRDALTLTTLPRQKDKGDEGIYYHTKWFSIRLPINERFLVWTRTSENLQASHEMWMFGKKFLTIDYEIHKL